MKTPEKLIAEICQVAKELPTSTVEALSEALSSADPTDPDDVDSRLMAVSLAPAHRALIDRLRMVWTRHSSTVAPTALALALTTADRCDEEARQREQVELLWSGPRAAGVPLRRSEQGLLEVIESAKEHLLVVSFAVYKVQVIFDALREACRRGVAVELVMESQKESEGRLSFDMLGRIHQDLGDGVTIYVWPAAKRPRSTAGKTGTLHAKCAVADARLLFISSANLTGHAMDINMELGVLITGGEKPSRVREQFQALRAQGVLEAVAPTTAKVVLGATSAGLTSPERPEWIRAERAAGMRFTVPVVTFASGTAPGDGPGIRDIGVAELDHDPGPGTFFVAPVPGDALADRVPPGTWALFRRCLPEESLPAQRSAVLLHHPGLEEVDDACGIVFREFHYQRFTDADQNVTGVRVHLWSRSATKGRGRICMDLTTEEWASFRPLAEFIVPYQPPRNDPTAEQEDV